MSNAQFLEAAMLVCFSLSWYWSILKMLQTKTACGKSLNFVLMVCAGYGFGISAKLVTWSQGGGLDGMIWIYGWNLLVTAFDAALMVRYSDTESVARALTSGGACGSAARRAAATDRRIGTTTTLSLVQIVAPPGELQAHPGDHEAPQQGHDGASPAHP